MSTTPANPWAWLGLLKWSLSYADGTRPSDLSPMSAEDRAFLEAVMRDGVVDENERMRTILREVTEQLQVWSSRDGGGATERRDDEQEEQQQRVQGLLQELRDIVEQIDFARAFAALKGIPFLLGCIQEPRVPLSTRAECCGILATMAQHNPPVQKELLEQGALRVLSDVHFDNSADPGFQARLIQAMSAIVRQNALGEAVFCRLEQALPLLLAALRRTPGGGAEAIQKRALFFLSALLTSDNSDRERVRQFNPVLLVVEAQYLLGDDGSPETREMALALVQHLLERDLWSLDDEHRQALTTLGHDRITILEQMTGDDAEAHAVELQQWRQLSILLAKESTSKRP